MTRLTSALMPGLLVALLATVITPPTALAQPALPGAPANPQATVDGNTVTLTWGVPLSGGAPASYTVVARTTSGGPVLAALPVGNVTAVTVAGPNGVFVVSLVAANAAGTGPESSAVTVTLPTLPAPPGAPTGLVAAAAGNTATFTWNPPSSGGVVGGYVLQAGTTPGFSIPIAALPLAASGTATSVPGVPAGTYYARVVARNSGGTSPPSNEASVTIAGPMAPGAPTLNPPTASGNTLDLSWAPGGGGAPTSYVLSARTAGGALVATVPLSGTTASFAGVPNGTYLLQLVAVNAVGTSPASNQVTVTLPYTGPPPIQQVGNDLVSASGSNFGHSVALSGNGQRMAVGAYTTANGTTRVYERVGDTWTQIGTAIEGEGAGDRAGFSVDLNDAGTRLAIGAYLNDAGGSNRGHVRVYDLVGSNWVQVGADIDGTANSVQMGWCVGLSATGSRLVTCQQHSGSVTGDVMVYDFVGGVWTQVGTTLTDGDEFGYAADISGDGTTIAVGASSASGSSRIGTAMVYRLSGGSWVPIGGALEGREIADYFGESVTLSYNGNRVVVAAPGDNAGDPNSTGRVRAFDLVGGTWTQVGQDVVGDPGRGLGDGNRSVALSADGTRFVVISPSQSVARVYQLVGGTWTQVGADIAPKPGAPGRANGVALSADGRTTAVGWTNNPPTVRVFSVAP